jgi:hypothetical protein
MVIYLAGNVTPPREEVLMYFKAHRLYSYFYHRQGGEFMDEFELRIKDIAHGKQPVLPSSCSH